MSQQQNNFDGGTKYCSVLLNGISQLKLNDLCSEAMKNLYPEERWIDSKKCLPDEQLVLEAGKGKINP